MEEIYFYQKDKAGTSQPKITPTKVYYYQRNILGEWSFNLYSEYFPGRVFTHRGHNYMIELTPYHDLHDNLHHVQLYSVRKDHVIQNFVITIYKADGDNLIINLNEGSEVISSYTLSDYLTMEQLIEKVKEIIPSENIFDCVLL